MGRPRKWASDAERKRTERGQPCPNTPVSDSKRTDKRTEPQASSKRTHENNYTPFAWHPEVDIKIFDGHGRFSPVNGFVLVSRRSEPNGNTLHGVVTEHDWRTRLDQSCVHDGQRLSGWSCKPCLPV